MWLAAAGCAGFVVPYVLAVAMPSWRWLLGCSVLVGGLLAYGFYEIASSQYEYAEVSGVYFLIFVGLAVPFGCGVLVRTVSLVMAARGSARKRVLAVNVLGFILPVGMVAMAAVLIA
jgi:hypothetical protein